MALVMESTSLQFEQPENFDILSEFRFGSNGDYWGPAELDVDSSTEELLSDRYVWDQDLSNGLDSLWCQVSLIVRAGDTTSVRWSLGGQSLVYDGPSLSSIDELEIRTGVAGQASVEWGALAVSFYREGTEVDYWAVETGSVIDRTQVTTPGEEMDILTVLPETSAVDEVRLSALVRITSPQGVYLDANDVFGQVVINGA